ncbi:MAG: hypothetical protein MJ061_06450, partial [Mailhella sp.]|nr:hypothetical protein [Mailhella sp.]
LAAAAAAAIMLCAASNASALTDDEARNLRRRIGQASYYVDEFEKEVVRARGSTSAMYRSRADALRRVKELVTEYPDEPEDKALYKRTSSVLMRSKGEFLEITPEMLAYRSMEERLRKHFGKVAEDAWAKLAAESGADLAAPVFPAPDWQTVSLKDLQGKTVVIPDVDYPGSMFPGATGSYLAAGAPSKGFYFIDASSRNFVGPWEAVKRCRREVDPSIGEQVRLTVLGTVTDIVTEVPEAEEDKLGSPQWGWVIRPVALYVPGRALGIYDASRESSGRWAGEDEAESIKRGMYSVTDVPAGASPEKVLEIFCTAIKEKNFALYAACIDPERQKTPTAKSLLRYHWDLHQERFHREYVAATFGKAEITVLKGVDGDDDLENFFLDEDQLGKLRKHEGERIEEAVVESRAWNESGRQLGSPQRHSLIRRNGGRWYVSDYAARF